MILNCKLLFAENYIDRDIPEKLILQQALSSENDGIFHFFSHGKSGELLVKGQWLGPKQLLPLFRQYVKSNPSIRSINIYGCEFAKGANGLAAVQYLEKGLNLPVAASNNVTGKDGDWLLEVGHSTRVLSVPAFRSNLQCAGTVGGTGPNDDFDGDGVCNGIDIDDDNDGVPDEMEIIVTNSLYTPTPKSSIVVTSQLTFGGGALANLVNGTDNSETALVNPSGTFAGNTWLKFELPTAQKLRLIELGHYNSAQMLFSAGSIYNIEGSNDNSAWTTIASNQSYQTTAPIYASNNSAKFSMPTNSTAYKYYRIQGVSGSSGGGWASEAYFQTYSEADRNTNGAGNVDRLDLDSDGDGCGDAFESGATTNSANSSATFKFTGSVGTNGLDNSLETVADNGTINYASTYSTYALSKFLALCADTDGDGLLDLVDIDDDNDGVLDATECPTCYYTIAEAATVVSVTTPLTLYTGPITNSYDKNLATYSGLNYGQAITGVTLYEITPTTSVSISSVGFVMQSWPMTTGGSSVVLQGYNGTAWENLSTAADHSTVTNGTDTFVNSLHPNSVYQKFRIQGVSGTTSYSMVAEIILNLNNYIPSAHPKLTCTTDADNDGKLNNVDLDSDGDGCSDAKEAGATTSTTPDFQFTPASTYPDANSNGLVDVKETGTTGTINYTSTYPNYAIVSTSNACSDTDGDGVADVIDLDDDNDGILDKVECPGDFTNMATGGGFSAAAAPSNWYSANASSNFETSIGVAGTYPNYSKNSTLTGGLFDEVDGVNTLGGLQNVAQINPEPNAIVCRLSQPLVASGFYKYSYDIGAASNTPSNIHYYFLKLYNADTDVVVATLEQGLLSTLPGYDSSPNFKNLTGSFTAPSSGNYYLLFTTDGPGSSEDDYIIDRVAVQGFGASVCDTDGDGIVNRLDLDSDGDGCPDSREAGVVTSFPAVQFSNTNVVNTGGSVPALTSQIASGTFVDANSNGFDDRLETGTAGTYSGTYTYAKAINSADVTSCPACSITNPSPVTGACAGANNLTFTLNLSGSNVGTTYNVSGATPATGTYGTPKLFTIVGGADGTNKTVNITDAASATCAITVTVTGVAACDVLPIATNDTKPYVAGSVTSINVLTNDNTGDAILPVTIQLGGTSSPGQSLQVPNEGTWSINTSTGEVTFTPDAGFTGVPTPITYTGKDADGNTSNAASITFTEDILPVATNDSAPYIVGSTTSINVLTNDNTGDIIVPSTIQLGGTSTPGESLTVPNEGTWSVNTSTGEVTFTPDGSFTGVPTPISYTGKDAQGNPSNSATITFIEDVLPVASDDTKAYIGGSTTSINVLTNDVTGDAILPATIQLAGTAGPGQPLVVAGEGTWSVNTSTGEVTFTSTGGFTGIPTPITYTGADAQGNISNAASITFISDELPIATDDTEPYTPGSTITVDVLANDNSGAPILPSTIKLTGTTNPGDPLTITGEGTWTVNTTTGALTFTPESGFTGTPTPISYTGKDTEGNESNPASVVLDAPPVAVNDLTQYTPGSPTSINVTSNDTGADPATIQLAGTASVGDPLTVPGEGMWTVNTGTGEVTFTPDPGFMGQPTPIQYTVKDAGGQTSNPATITLDAPPMVTNDTENFTGGSPVTVNVLDNDSRVDPATVQIVGTSAIGDPLVVPGEGTWSINPTTGQITFTPESGFLGDPTPIQYTVKDPEGNTSTPASVTLISDVCLMEIGGIVLDDMTGPTGGVNGTPINGTDLIWMSLVSDSGTPTIVDVVPVDGTGHYKFVDVLAGTYRIVVSASAAGSLNKQLPVGFYTSVEGGPVNGGVAEGDGDPNSETTITADCNGISYQDGPNTLESASYLENNFGLSTTPLPVTLTSFKAKASTEGNILEWTTSEEKDFDRFEIETSTSPKDGFTKLAEMKGGTNKYQYTDSKPSKGSSYYRLKMVDLDGSYAYSHIVNAYQQYGENEHIVFPNPSRVHRISIHNYFDISAVRIYDVTGKAVKMKLSKESGNYIFNIDPIAPSGPYVLEYRVGAELVRRKFILE